MDFVELLDMPKKIDSDQLDLILGGRDAKGRFQSRIKQIESLKQAVIALNKEQSKLEKQALRSLGVENNLLKGKVKLQGQVIHLTQNLAKQRQEMERSIRSNNSFASSFTRLASAIGATALAYKAIGQLRNIADARRSLAISGGLDTLKSVKGLHGPNIATVSAAQLVDEFLRQSTTNLSLGRSPEIQSGLLKLQDSFRGVGTEIGNQIIMDLTKSLEPKRLQSFLSEVGSGADIEQTLRQYQSQQNLSESLRALNALEVTQVPSTGDPILDTQRAMSEATEKLKAEFERLASTVSADLIPVIERLIPTLNKLMEFVGGLSTGKLLAGGAALMGGSALLKGVGGSLLPKVGLRGTAGFGLRSAGKLASPLGLLATAAGLNAVEGYGVMTDAESAFNATQGGKQWQPRLAGNSERDRLAFQRQRLDKIMSEMQPAGTESSWLGLTQLTGEFTPNQNRQHAKLSAQRAKIQAEIDAIDRSVSVQVQATEAKRAEIKAIEGVTESAEKLATKMKAVPASKIDKDLEAVFKRASLSQDLSVQQSETMLKRIDVEIASVGPYGLLAAGPQAESLLKSLDSQRDVLQKILETIDTSTTTGQVQANDIVLQLKQNQLESKTLQRHLVTAYLDQAIQSVFQSGGGHRSIIMSLNKNVGIGLRKGVIDLPRDIARKVAGNVDPSVTPGTPQTALEILGRNPFGFNELNKPLTPSSMMGVTTEGDKLITRAIEGLQSVWDSFTFQRPQTSVPSIPSTPTSKGRVGSDSSQTLREISKLAAAAADQLAQESAYVEQRFVSASDVSEVGFGRLTSVIL